MTNCIKSTDGSLQYVAPTEALTVWRAGMEVLAEHDTPFPAEVRLRTMKILHEAKDIFKPYNTWTSHAFRTVHEAKDILDAWSSSEDVGADEAQNMLMQDLDVRELIVISAGNRTVQYSESYFCSSLSSWNLQRFATRGNVDTMQLYATPQMHKFLEQAKEFYKDPTMQLASEDEEIGALTIDIASREEEIMRLNFEIED